MPGPAPSGLGPHSPKLPRGSSWKLWLSWLSSWPVVRSHPNPSFEFIGIRFGAASTTGFAHVAYGLRRFRAEAGRPHPKLRGPGGFSTRRGGFIGLGPWGKCPHSALRSVALRLVAAYNACIYPWTSCSAKRGGVQLKAALKWQSCRAFALLLEQRRLSLHEALIHKVSTSNSSHLLNDSAPAGLCTSYTGSFSLISRSPSLQLAVPCPTSQPQVVLCFCHRQQLPGSPE